MVSSEVLGSTQYPQSHPVKMFEFEGTDFPEKLFSEPKVINGSAKILIF